MHRHGGKRASSIKSIRARFRTAIAMEWATLTGSHHGWITWLSLEWMPSGCRRSFHLLWQTLATTYQISAISIQSSEPWMILTSFSRLCMPGASSSYLITYRTIPPTSTLGLYKADRHECIQNAIG